MINQNFSRKEQTNKFSKTSEFSETLKDIAVAKYDLDPAIHVILNHFQHQTMATLPAELRKPFGPEALSIKRDQMKTQIYQVIDQALQEAITTDPRPTQPEIVKLRASARQDKMTAMQTISATLTKQSEAFFKDSRTIMAHILEHRLCPLVKIDLENQQLYSKAYSEFDITLLLHLIQTITGDTYDINQRVMKLIQSFQSIKQSENESLSVTIVQLRQHLQQQ